jgi:hypothetical protein
LDFITNNEHRYLHSLLLHYDKRLKTPIKQSAKPTPSPGEHCRENRCGVVESSLELHKGRDFQTVKFPSFQSIPSHGSGTQIVVVSLHPLSLEFLNLSIQIMDHLETFFSRCTQLPESTLLSPCIIALSFRIPATAFGSKLLA